MVRSPPLQLWEHELDDNYDPNLVARVDVFRVHDKRTVRLIHCGFCQTVQELDEDGDLNADGRLTFESANAYTLAFLGSFEPTFDRRTKRIRWAFSLCAERRGGGHRDAEDPEELVMPEDEWEEEMSESGFLCALENAKWA